MEEELCAKCHHASKQGDGQLYPDFCKRCANDFKRMLDKVGILNKLQKKIKK